jgi:hypothetical protein
MYASDGVVFPYCNPNFENIFYDGVSAKDLVSILLTDGKEHVSSDFISSLFFWSYYFGFDQDMREHIEIRSTEYKLQPNEDKDFRLTIDITRSTIVVVCIREKSSTEVQVHVFADDDSKACHNEIVAENHGSF